MKPIISIRYLTIGLAAVAITVSAFVACTDTAPSTAPIVFQHGARFDDFSEGNQLDTTWVYGENCPSGFVGTYPDCEPDTSPDTDPCTTDPGSPGCGDYCLYNSWDPSCPSDPTAGGGGGGGLPTLIDGTDDTGYGDNCTDIGYDPYSLSATSSWNKAGFATALRANALPYPGKGKCAHYVRIALCNGGGVRAACNGGPNAGKYGPYLTGMGFVIVTTGSGLTYPAGYTPQVGDIAVFVYGDNGHVCGWDGTAWISDFVQRPEGAPASIQPDPNTVPNRPYTIYRKP